ncbi:MAG TPA: porphyrin biosynthesis protein [Saprospirales bacterium]|nr:porphyrin biosynthesis protein [Saprospirales bacterium]
MNQTDLLAAISATYPDRNNQEFTPKEILSVARKLGLSDGQAKKFTESNPRVRWGVYKLEGLVVPFQKKEDKIMASVTSIMNDEVFVPQKDQSFVSWGHFKDVVSVIKSSIFYPVYVTGLSGNGKTMMVEQACAKLNREYVRVQITPETDEDDLIGGFRLVNGETVFNKGPVIKAMEKGAILLIDEIDRGSNKIMCLQGVLEGKPVLIKKTGEVINPSNGFNVIATANTKGKGSEDGRFIAATIIDEAFLERFTITLEQPYPSSSVERKIIINHMQKFNCLDESFADNLTVWSETIRKTFADGGVDEIISTRRLCHIVQSYSIFGDKLKAIQLCVSRFDEDTRDGFLDLYTKVDAEPAPEQNKFINDSDWVDNPICDSIDNIIDNL